MPLPAGITTATVTFGATTDFLGNPVSTKLKIQPSATIFWTGTNAPVVAFGITTESDAEGSVVLPHTDQPGFVDINGAPILHWSYIATGEWKSSAGSMSFRKEFLLPSTMTIVDFDTMAGGAIGTTSPPSMVGPQGPPGSTQALNVKDYGALGNGTANDQPAIMAAINAADTAGGGTVWFPAGTYKLDATIGKASTAINRVALVGAGERAAVLLAAGNFPVVSGAWFMSALANLMIDGGAKGAPGMNVSLDKSYVRHCQVRGWTTYGIVLNDGTYGDLGLLNWIEDCHIEQCTGYGIWQTYRFVDSWICNNNIGSTEANLSIEGGPLRIMNNHLNGAPKYNIEMRGNKRIAISGNICEGSRREAIIYTMPPWLSSDDCQTQIVGNAFSNGGKASAGTYPAIGIYSIDGTKRTAGFNVTGNIFACEDAGAGWNYAVHAPNVNNVAITGNQWETRGFSVAAVNVSGTKVVVSGNTSGNTA